MDQQYLPGPARRPAVQSVYSLLSLFTCFTTHLRLAVECHHLRVLRRAQAVLLRSNHLFHKRSEVLLAAPVDLALRVPQRRKGNSQQFPGQFHRTLLQIIRSNHFWNEPQGETFMSIETVTEQAEVLSTAGANEPGQTHWPQSGN